MNKIYSKKTQILWACIGFLFTAVIMAVLQKNYNILNANTIISSFFGGCIGYLLGEDLVKHTYNKSWYPTIGMLGTFVGIVFGLYDLNITDPANLTSGLEKLLSGLKLAFITSIMGVSVSGLRKFLDYAGLNKIEETDQAEESLKVIENQVDGTKTIIEVLKNNNTKIVEELRKVSANVAEMATKSFSDAFVKAAKNISGDLNKQLSDKIGEKLDKFVDSVDVLSEWQKENKKIMEKYTEQLNVLIQSAENVKEMVDKANETIEKTYGTLKHLEQIGKEAKDFVPAIEEVIEKTKEEIVAFSDITTGISTSVGEISNTIDNLTTNIETAVTSVSDNLGKVVENTAAELGKKLETEYEKVSTSITTETGKITQAVTSAVSKSQNSLSTAGGLLSGIMSQLAEDIYDTKNKYEETTEKIEKIEKTAEAQTTKKGRKK